MGYRRCRLRGPELGRRIEVDRFGNLNSRSGADIQYSLFSLNCVAESEMAGEGRPTKDCLAICNCNVHVMLFTILASSLQTNS